MGREVADTLKDTSLITSTANCAIEVLTPDKLSLTLSNPIAYKLRLIPPNDYV